MEVVSRCIKYANASFYDADIKQGSKRIGAKKGVKMLNSCIKLYYVHNITNYDLCTQTYLAFFNPEGSGVAAVKRHSCLRFKMKI